MFDEGQGGEIILYSFGYRVEVIFIRAYYSVRNVMSDVCVAGVVSERTGYEGKQLRKENKTKGGTLSISSECRNADLMTYRRGCTDSTEGSDQIMTYRR